MQEGNFIRYRPELRNQGQCVFAYDKFRPNRIMRNRFMLFAEDGEGGFVLWVESVLLLFRLNAQTDNSGTEYILLQYMEHTGNA